MTKKQEDETFRLMGRSLTAQNHKNRKSPLRICLGILNDDDWLLGIICAKCGLIDYAMRKLLLRQISERNHLFGMGIADSVNMSLEDIAYELNKIRTHSPVAFDQEVIRNLGTIAHARIVRVIRDYQAGKIRRKEYPNIADALAVMSTIMQRSKASCFDENSVSRDAV